MLRLHQMHVPKSLVILVVVESIIVFGSFYCGLFFSWVDFRFTLGEIYTYLHAALLYSCTLLIIMFSMGLYSPVNIRKYVETIIRLSVSVVLSFAVLTAIFYALPIMAVWRSVIFFTIVTSFFGILAIRFLALQVIDSDRLKRRVVVIGVGDRAARIEELTQKGLAIGFNCIGYFDPGGEEIKVPRSRILSRVNKPVDFFLESGVDEIVVAVSDRRGGLPMRTLRECQLNGILVVDYMTFFACETGHVDLDALQPSWFLFSNGFRGNRSYKVMKRSLDVVLSLALLVFLVPIMCAASIAIALESRGPIFHRQVRAGRQGQPFTLLKFRSMHNDAEEDGIPRWASSKDARATRVGAFLRRTRVDELPQLFNVLAGNMSIVGPRPERPYFVEQLGQTIPYYSERHAIKPGLMGWAQLHYPYGASVQDARRKLEYDLYYLNYCGLFLDLLIILQSIRIVILPQTAH